MALPDVRPRWLVRCFGQRTPWPETADRQSRLVSGGDGRGDRGSATGVGQERGGEGGGVGWDGVTGFGFVGSRGESA